MTEGDEFKLVIEAASAVSMAIVILLKIARTISLDLRGY